MKRILLINDLLVGGGSETVVRVERELLIKNGYDVYTISFGLNDIETPNNFVLRSSGVKSKINKFIFCSKLKSSITEIINKVAPNLIHLHLISKFPLAIYNSIGLKKIPVIQSLHGPNLFCASGWGGLKNSAPCELGIGTKCYFRGCVNLSTSILYLQLKNRYWKSLKESVDLFHCPSLNMLNTAKRLGFDNSVYLPLAIDNEFLKVPKRKKLGRPILLFMGAIAEQKGVQILLPSLAKIKLKIPNVLLRIAGQGVLLEDLKKEVDILGLNQNVEFLGFIKHHEVREFYLSGDVFLMPSVWHEQFGLVGPEALSCEIPIIGSNIGGIPEWLKHNENGLLVPPQDINELSIAAIKLLEDSKLREEMGVNGRKFVLKEFGGLKFSQELLKMINKFI
jgi:glycosyltransferase involved in cell wall biosynthesis